MIMPFQARVLQGLSIASLEDAMQILMMMPELIHLDLVRSEEELKV